MVDADTIFHMQPTGRFLIGGPQVRSKGGVKSFLSLDKAI